MTLRSLLLIALFLGAGPLPAQVFAGQRGQQWWHHQRLYSTEDDHTMMVEAPKEKTRHAAVPSGRLFAIKDGVAYARVMNSATHETTFLKSDDLTNWVEAFQVEPGQPVILGFYPLGNGKVFLAAGIDPFIKDGKLSFWAIAKPTEKGLLSIQELPDLGIPLTEWARWVPAKEAGKAARISPRPEKVEQFLEVGTANLVPCSEGFVIVLPRQGRLLVVDGEDGHLIRQRTLYPSVEESLKQGKVIERAILGCRPTRDGNLLLMTRSEDAVLSSRSIFTAPKPQEGQTKEEHQLEIKRSQDENLEAFGEILWWEFNPATGDFLRRSTPKGFPAHIRTMDDMGSFAFRMTLKNEPEMQ